MSTTVKDLLNNIKKVNVQAIITDAVKRNKGQITDLNKIELEQGRNYLEQVVGKYSKSTELISKTTNPRQPKKAGEPYNHENTGRLFDGMFITYNGKVIKINSKGLGDNQKQLFISINRLLGFTDKAGKIINNDILLPDLQKKFKQKTKL